MNFKQFLLLEMPHFTIANKSYDLFAEKDKSVFKNVIKIFRNYSKSDIQKLFQQNRFLILFLKNYYKFLSEPKKAEVNNKFKNSGLGYVVDLIS